MSLTDSTMMPLGKKAPDFSLPDTVSGQTVSFEDVAGEKGTVVVAGSVFLSAELYELASGRSDPFAA